jgi:hypothetical protein
VVLFETPSTVNVHYPCVNLALTKLAQRLSRFGKSYYYISLKIVPHKICVFKIKLDCLFPSILYSSLFTTHTHFHHQEKLSGMIQMTVEEEKLKKEKTDNLY